MAAAVMAFGISTAIVAMQRGFATLDSARNLTTAAQILACQIEQLRMHDWATVSGYGWGPTTLALDGEFSASSSVGTRYTVTRTTRLLATDLLEVTYTVAWRGADGRSHTRAMTTCYARHGIHDYYYNHS